MAEYISIRAVLDPTYFSRPLRKETDDDTILSYALSGYRLLNIPQKLEECTAVLEVKNHSVQFTDNVKETDINTINLIVFYESSSDLKNDIFKPLRYMGNRKIKNSFLETDNGCKICNYNETNGCSEVFSVTPFNEITTSLKEGFVCISYLKEVKDEFGNYLILKDENILKFLGTYAAAMIWRDRGDTKEEQAFNMYRSKLQESELLLKKAKGSFIQRNIDLNLIDSISGTNSYNQRLTRCIEYVWSKNDN